MVKKIRIKNFSLHMFKARQNKVTGIRLHSYTYFNDAVTRTTDQKHAESHAFHNGRRKTPRTTHCNNRSGATYCTHHYWRLLPSRIWRHLTIYKLTYVLQDLGGFILPSNILYHIPTKRQLIKYQTARHFNSTEGKQLFSRRKTSSLVSVKDAVLLLMQ